MKDRFIWKHDGNVLLPSPGPLSFAGQTYPAYGNAVIVAGHSDRWKTEQIIRLFQLEHKLDTGPLKAFLRDTPQLQPDILETFGTDVSGWPLDTATEVATVHEFLHALGENRTYMYKIADTARRAAADRKPNLIYDHPLHTGVQFTNLTYGVNSDGYRKENTHLVWMLDDAGAVQKRNQQSLEPEDEYFLDAGISETAVTMKLLFQNSYGINRNMDGDIWLVMPYAADGTPEIIKLKSAGESATIFDRLAPAVKAKILKYIPDFAQCIWR